uniref:Uncharacterized protein n=1 Tax=Glossina brevipalpis TaxID=37001 RepID=A0A1A9WX45_9MUSC
MSGYCEFFHFYIDYVWFVHLSFCNFLRWNCNGTALLLDLGGLDAKLNRGGGIDKAISAVDEEEVMELPVDLFENPHNSVLHSGDNLRSHHAGYYGTYSIAIPNFSSGLEPIFKTEEEQKNVNYMQEGTSITQINQNCMDTQVDI